MAPTAWLLSHGFRPAGAWDSPLALVHRAPWLRRSAGVYAFVLDDEVHYIGKADALHRRLRNYSRRCFGLRQVQERRRVHDGIVAAVERGCPVSVYALVLASDCIRTPGQVEAALIAEARPVWNISLNGGSLANPEVS